jgi:hypothetical protein
LLLLFWRWILVLQQRFQKVVTLKTINIFILLFMLSLPCKIGKQHNSFFKMLKICVMPILVTIKIKQNVLRFCTSHISVGYLLSSWNISAEMQNLKFIIFINSFKANKAPLYHIVHIICVWFLKKKILLYTNAKLWCMLSWRTNWNILLNYAWNVCKSGHDVQWPNG